MHVGESRCLQHQMKAFLLVLLMTVPALCGRKFCIHKPTEQIFKIVEKVLITKPMSSFDMAMTPSFFNYAFPFTVHFQCEEGKMRVKGMRRVNQSRTFMEVIDGNESSVNLWFTVAEIDFIYHSCWLNTFVPVPMRLRGTLDDSQFYVKARIEYEPECKIALIEKNLISYAKLSVNYFDWLPLQLGDRITDFITRKLRSDIYTIASNTIDLITTKLVYVYDACLVFPAQGKMKRYMFYVKDMENGVEGNLEKGTEEKQYNKTLESEKESIAAMEEFIFGLVADQLSGESVGEVGDVLFDILADNLLNDEDLDNTENAFVEEMNDDSISFEAINENGIDEILSTNASEGAVNTEL